MRLVSVTPVAAEQLLLQQQGILGWEARVAPSATPLSAFQSNCLKQRQREHWLDGSLIQSLTIILQFIILTGACSCEIKYKADLNHTFSSVSRVLKSTTLQQRYSHCKSVCLHACD